MISGLDETNADKVNIMVTGKGDNLAVTIRDEISAKVHVGNIDALPAAECSGSFSGTRDVATGNGSYCEPQRTIIGKNYVSRGKIFVKAIVAQRNFFTAIVIGIIAIILLIGIVKKNGIMIVDVALRLEREQGLPAEEAARQASHQRLRPILMTTACAALGGVPMILMQGTGSEFRQPLGWAIVGGLVVSQALTLFSTPVVYIYLDRLRRRRRPEPRQATVIPASQG